MKSRERIVHMTTVHHPTDPRIYHKQIKSLAKAGYDVYYIAKDDEALQKSENIHHIPIKTYQNRLKRMIFGSLEVYRKAKQLKADVYHFHDPELMIVGWLLKRKHNIVIYDVHEDYVTSISQKVYLHRFLRNFFAKIYTWLERLFTKKMELSLAEKYYYDIYQRGEKILNYPILHEATETYNRKDQPLEDKLLYTGNVSKDRGALIHAQIPHLDDRVSVHFVGKCPKNLAQQMYETAKESKSRLHIQGIDQFVEKEEIEQRYFERHWLAGLALFPPTDHYMKKELTKFFEYMSVGLPILCSNFPVWKKFIETYKCGIAVDPLNKREIQQAITYLREHPSEARQMGENGKEAVMKKLNWKTEEEKLLTWYERLLSKNR